MEEYDFYDDQEYITWLQLTHPEAVPNSITTPPDGPSLLDDFLMFFQLTLFQWTIQLILKTIHSVTPPCITPCSGGDSSNSPTCTS